MAKALLGYVGGANPAPVRDNARLRLRVSDLEAEILRLKTENDALHAALSEHLEPEKLLETASH